MALTGIRWGFRAGAVEAAMPVRTIFAATFVASSVRSTCSPAAAIRRSLGLGRRRPDVRASVGARRLCVRRSRTALHRLRHGLRPAALRPHASGADDRARRARRCTASCGARRIREEIRLGRTHSRALAVDGAHALRDDRNRSDDERDSRRARLHRTRR